MLHFEPKSTPDRTPLGPLPGWMSALLRARGIHTEAEARRFLSPSLSDLHDPFLLEGMEAAVRLIREAVAQRTPIVVYGDYDVDGVCASAILWETLRELGAEASVRIPLRHTEGYGLHETAVREIAGRAGLLITVDCGIASVAEVALARSLGLKVIVTDHHELPPVLPEADALLDPLRGQYPFPRLCGAGVALKVCQALLGMDAVERRLDLAALATVADVVPLQDENRVIVREGLSRMPASPRPGLRALMRVSGLAGSVRAEDLAFRLGPRINAAGRMEDAFQAFTLLTTADEAQAAAIAEHLEENNRLRQQEERRILLEARRQLAEGFSFRENRAILLAGEGWNRGLIGLVAGRICEETHFPTLVFSISEGEAVGSCRSIPGVHIFQMLSQCSDLLLRFGGHAQAAGLTLEAKRLPELQRRLTGAIRAAYPDQVFLPVRTYDLQMPFRELTMDHLELLDQLEPTGFGNDPAVFVTEDVEALELRRVGQDRSHLRLVLQDREAQTISGIGFSLGDEADRGLTRVDVLYQPSRNTFRGQTSVQLTVQALRPARGSAPLPGDDVIFESCLQEMSRLSANKGEYGFLSSLTEEEAIERLSRPLGTLALTRSRDRARALAEASGASLESGRITDPQGYSAVLCAWQAQELRDQWDTVLLADGALLPGETEALRAACPHADICLVGAAVPAVPDLAPLLLPREAFARLYRCLLGKLWPSAAALAEAAGLSRNQALAGLHAFAEAGLIAWQSVPFRVTLLPRPAEKADLDAVPLLRYLRGAAGQR